MTTNLKSIAGTDFDDLFEAGTGNQLLNIYAMDGHDVGQKYLNVSQGSQVSANTGFQASDSADVKTKLCGKGTNKAGVSYRVTAAREGNEYRVVAKLYIQITTSKPCTVAGSFTYTYRKNTGTSRSPHYTVGTITDNFSQVISATGTATLCESGSLVAAYAGINYGVPQSFSGTITCGSFSASFSNSSPSGSF